MPLHKKAPHKTHADHKPAHSAEEPRELPVLSASEDEPRLESVPDDVEVIAMEPVPEPKRPARSWFGWLKRSRPAVAVRPDALPVEASHQHAAQSDDVEEIDLQPLDEEVHRKKTEKTEKKDAEIEKGLQAIYMGRDGALPDLSHLERSRSKTWLWVLAMFGAVISLLAIAAWLGFFFFQPFREYKGGGLQLAITGPSEIALGREEAFEINWQNVEKTAIGRVEIRVGLPPDFVPTSFEPPLSKTDVRSWQLSALAVGEKGTLHVRGIFVGALGTHSAVQAIGTYRPAGFNRDFEALATQPVTYARTVLEGCLDAPEKTAVGENVTLTYSVSNKGERPLKDLIARVSYPAGFVPTIGATTSVAFGDHELFLPIGEIASAATTTVKVFGVFASGVSGDQLFLAQAGRYGSDGSFLPAQKTEGHIAVMAGDLALQFVVNGSDADRTIQPGDLLRITIGYQNTSPEALKGIAITLGFESVLNGRSTTGTTLLDWAKLEQMNPGASSTKPRIQTIRYDKTTIPALETLLPQAEGTIELSIPTLSVASGTHEATIRLMLQADIPVVGTSKVNRTLKSRPIELKERSDADLSVEARYFTEEGAPVGFGPLPPVAGKTTAYLVTWHLTKSLHPLEQIKATAILPKIAAWSARVIADAGSMTYDPETRTVTWFLDKVPESVKDLQASFEVQLTPETVDIGRFASLLGETQFQATDPIVHELISRVKPPVTTDLQNDEGARGKGVVRKP